MACSSSLLSVIEGPDHWSYVQLHTKHLHVWQETLIITEFDTAKFCASGVTYVHHFDNNCAFLTT